ncbi:MAG: endonuclease MutS2 [Bacillota bacterium]|nr:endonuclease MutS2 [Bacillota bacterium]
MADLITEREIKILEFDEIRRQLADYTASPMGRECMLNLSPNADYKVIENLQKESSEAKLLSVKNAFTPSTVEDILPLISRADKGSILTGAELAVISTFMKAVHRWQHFFKDIDNSLLYPRMAELAKRFKACEQLYRELVKSLDQDGNILDSASSALSSIRRKTHALQFKIRDKLDEYIRSPLYRRYLQESLVTIRSNRFVIPVKQEYRQQVDGVVHDQSASGATLFIEPLPVVRMQNELVALHKEEEKEIERILIDLSLKISGEKELLISNRELYTSLDIITARGRLSFKMGGSEPVLIRDGFRVAIKNGIHPLLTGERVPLNLELEEDVRTLVITGPNTGGKTVALKTIGLLAVMTQCGLHLPAEKETGLPVFRKIRADIGDEQSIVQSLSTFSGHMKNIIEIVDTAESGTLVLFDELGAGTDPSEGSALAMAILEELTGKGALTVATTHINELKLFAQMQKRMQNAAMEFDLETLEPTYRLLQGIPGQSNAFHIARRLGLSEQILEKAKSFLHRAHDQVESVIAQLVEDQQRYSRDSEQAALDRSRAELLIQDLEREQSLIKSRRDDILKEAREEARQLVRKTKTTVDDMIKEIRILKTEGGSQSLAGAERLRQDIIKLRQEMNQVDEDDLGDSPDPAELLVGMEVYIQSLRQKGEIISFTEQEALVQVGVLRVNLPLTEFKTVKNQVSKKSKERSVSSGGGYSVRKEEVTGSSIDIRGLTLEESIPLVDKLIDNALWAGLNRVELIHGKGTGKLKTGLRDYLKTHKLVSRFRGGSSAEGGEGVTVVEIKS